MFKAIFGDPGLRSLALYLSTARQPPRQETHCKKHLRRWPEPAQGGTQYGETQEPLALKEEKVSSIRGSGDIRVCPGIEPGTSRKLSFRVYPKRESYR